MANDDKRAAVGFSVSLSSQLIAASMAMLAVQGAYVWYALGARVTRTGFEIFAALAALSIAISIFSAGKAITKARNAGFAGEWSLQEGKTQFDLQAKSLLIAMIFLGIMFALSGRPKESTVESKVTTLTSEVALLREELRKRNTDSNNKMDTSVSPEQRTTDSDKTTGPPSRSPQPKSP